MESGEAKRMRDHSGAALPAPPPLIRHSVAGRTEYGAGSQAKDVGASATFFNVDDDGDAHVPTAPRVHKASAATPSRAWTIHDLAVLLSVLSTTP
jgi:hypothetical protein